MGSEFPDDLVGSEFPDDKMEGFTVKQRALDRPRKPIKLSRNPEGSERYDGDAPLMLSFPTLL